jgi:hypothetical protein
MENGIPNSPWVNPKYKCLWEMAQYSMQINKLVDGALPHGYCRDIDEGFQRYNRDKTV